MSGTVALWYSGTSDPPPKLEAAYVRGRLHGVKRSWHPDGRVRAEFRYGSGTLLYASAFDVAGKALSALEARALAARDVLDDAKEFASLDQLVRDNLLCNSAGVGDARTNRRPEEDSTRWMRYRAL